MMLRHVSEFSAQNLANAAWACDLFLVPILMIGAYASWTTGNFEKYALLFSGILIFRALCIFATVIPSSSCRFHGKSIGMGGCRDQIISGHTACAVLAAHAIGVLYPRCKAFCYLYAGFVALSLIFTRQHYTVDVLLGSALASLVLYAAK